MTTQLAQSPPLPSSFLDCDGYRSLVASVERDEAKGKHHDYRGKLEWAVTRAKHYAEKTGLTPEAILDAWEAKRNYWYMNYYQPSNQPEIKEDKVRVFETIAELQESIGEKGFRCPACEGVSQSPYECASGIKKEGKACGWKVYGLLGHLGKGVSVFVKEKLELESLFMPVAWELNAKTAVIQ